MADLWHQFGGDLVISATGDLLLAAGPSQGEQRILRRLLTNPGDYVWQLSYGAGLGQFVGQPSSGSRIQGVILGQIFSEAAVAQTPQPAVDISTDPTGIVTVALRYADSTTGTTQQITIPVGSG